MQFLTDPKTGACYDVTETAPASDGTVTYVETLTNQCLSCQENGNIQFRAADSRGPYERAKKSADGAFAIFWPSQEDGQKKPDRFVFRLIP